MAIEISGSGANHTPLVTESQKQQVQPQQQSNAVQPTPVTGQSSDSVSLTGTASQLRALEQQLVNQPVVDTQRVASIRHEINSGQYTVHPERVAEKMIQMENMISQRLG